MDDTPIIVPDGNTNLGETATELTGVAVEDREATELLPNAFLERLPAELAGLVFDWLRIILEVGGGKTFSHPLSRTLLPFIRTNLYHTVKIETCALLDFCDTVERYSLHSAIHRLVCSTPARPAYSRMEPDWRPHEARLLRFFRSTIQLSHLNVDSLFQLSLLLLSPHFASVCLPKLESLHVRSNRPDPTPVFRFRRFYSRLNELEVTATTEYAPGASPSCIVRSEYDGKQLPPDRVTSIVVEGELGSFDTPSFLATFFVVKSCTLSVEYEYPECDLVAILEQLNPASLIDLSIYAFDRGARMAVDTVLLRCEGLRSLRLSGKIFTQNVFPNLRRFPHLAALALDDNCQVTLSALEPLLTGPTKVESFKKVAILEMLSWGTERGEAYLDNDHEFGFDDEEPDVFSPQRWRLPEWTDEFPLDDVRSFVALAKSERIDVGDKMRAMMDMMDAYEEEVEQCEIYSRTAEGRARIAAVWIDLSQKERQSEAIIEADDAMSVGIR